MENETTSNYVLITGATSGIGYELAKLFAANNYNLAIVARHEDDLEARATEFRKAGVNVEIFACDLFDREETISLCEEIHNRRLEIEILVNNAGQGEYGLFLDNDLERELDIVELNISALLILTKQFTREMMGRHRGKILNVASVVSSIPGPWQAVYHATKAFVLSFSEALRSELQDSGITVTALLPGVTDTDFFIKAGMQESKAVQDPDAMADPSKVASDGFDALMAGDDKVISGTKNKIQVAMGHLTPDSSLADQMKSKQEPKQQ